jgi:hypothetical protein
VLKAKFELGLFESPYVQVPFLDTTAKRHKEIAKLRKNQL